MRVSVPGIPGVYYDTDAKTTAVTTVLSAASRRAPKPNGYALQALALLWSIDVDLREVPNDHPLQYLHPEGAYSLEEFSRDRVPGPDVGPGVERAFQFAYAVNREAERGIDGVLGREESAEGTAIEITEGSSASASTGETTASRSTDGAAAADGTATTDGSASTTDGSSTDATGSSDATGSTPSSGFDDDSEPTGSFDPSGESERTDEFDAADE